MIEQADSLMGSGLEGVVRFMSRVAWLCVLSLFAEGAAVAGDTTAYQYDALGRLMSSTVTPDGGPAVASTSIGYDPAGNRSSYQVATGGGSQMSAAGGGAQVGSGTSDAVTPASSRGNGAAATTAPGGSSNGAGAGPPGGR